MIIYVDVSNLGKLDSTSWSLSLIEIALENLATLTSGRQVALEPIADANLRYRFTGNERKRYENLLEEGQLTQAPAAIEADVLLLDGAHRNGGIVISNDLYRDFHRHHSWLHARGRGRHIAASFSKNEQRWAFFERYPNAEIPRSLTELLDEAAPRIETLADLITLYGVNPSLFEDYLMRSGLHFRADRLTNEDIDQVTEILGLLRRFPHVLSKSHVDRSLLEVLFTFIQQNPTAGIQVGDLWLVNEAAKQLISEVAQSAWNTSNRQKVQELLFSDGAVDRGDIAWVYGIQDDPALVALVRSWDSALSGNPSVDWLLIGQFDQALPNHLIAQLSRDSQVLVLANISNVDVDAIQLSDESRLSIICAKFLSRPDPSFSDVKKLLKTWHALKVSGSGTIGLETELPLFAAVRNAFGSPALLSNPKFHGRWPELARIIRKIAPADDLLVICDAMSGDTRTLSYNHEVSPIISNADLRKAFARYSLKLPWISPDQVRAAAESLFLRSAAPPKLSKDHLLRRRDVRVELIEAISAELQQELLHRSDLLSVLEGSTYDLANGLWDLGERMRILLHQELEC